MQQVDVVVVQIEVIEVDREVVAVVLADKVVEVGLVEEFPTVGSVEEAYNAQEYSSGDQSKLDAILGEELTLFHINPKVNRSSVYNRVDLEVHDKAEEERRECDPPLEQEHQDADGHHCHESIGIASCRHVKYQWIQYPYRAQRLDLPFPQPGCHPQDLLYPLRRDHVRYAEEDLSEAVPPQDVGHHHDREHWGVSVGVAIVGRPTFRHVSGRVGVYTVVDVAVLHVRVLLIMPFAVDREDDTDVERPRDEGVPRRDDIAPCEGWRWWKSRWFNHA